MMEIKIGSKYRTNMYENVLDIRNGEIMMIKPGTVGVAKKVSQNARCTMVLIESDVIHGWIMEDSLEPEVCTDAHGHRLYWVPEDEAIRIIGDEFINKRVRTIYVGSDRAEPASLDDLSAVEGWSQIVRCNLPFDNCEEEILLMMGYLGGGYVGTAYCNTDDMDRFWFDSQIKTMLENVTGNSADHKYFLQLIDVDYDGDEKNEQW